MDQKMSPPQFMASFPSGVAPQVDCLKAQEEEEEDLKPALSKEAGAC